MRQSKPLQSRFAKETRRQYNNRCTSPTRGEWLRLEPLARAAGLCFTHESIAAA